MGYLARSGQMLVQAPDPHRRTAERPHKGIRWGRYGRVASVGRIGLGKKGVVRAGMGVFGSSTIDRVNQGPPGFEPPRNPAAQRTSPPQTKKAYSPYKSSSDLSSSRVQKTSQTKKESYESSPNISRPRGSKDIIKTKIRHLITGTRSTSSARVLRVSESFRPFRPICKSKNNNKGSPPVSVRFKSPGCRNQYGSQPAPDGPRIGPSGKGPVPLRSSCQPVVPQHRQSCRHMGAMASRKGGLSLIYGDVRLFSLYDRSIGTVFLFLY